MYNVDNIQPTTRAITLRRLIFKIKYRKKALNISLNTPVTQSILCVILTMSAEILESLNYTGQASKKHSFEFMFLTHQWPWNKVKVTIPVWIGRSQAMLQSCKVWKTLLKSVQEMENATFVCLFVSLLLFCFCFGQIKEHIKHLPWTHAKVKLVIYSWSSQRN